VYDALPVAVLPEGEVVLLGELFVQKIVEGEAAKERGALLRGAGTNPALPSFSGPGSGGMNTGGQRGFQ